MKQFVRNQGQNRQLSYTDKMGEKYKDLIHGLELVHKLHGPVASATQSVKDAERALANAKDDESKAKAEGALATAKDAKAKAEAPWEAAKQDVAQAIVAERDLVMGTPPTPQNPNGTAPEQEQRILMGYLQEQAVKYVVRGGKPYGQTCEPGLLMALANSAGAIPRESDAEAKTPETESVTDEVAGEAEDIFDALRFEAASRFKLVTAAISFALKHAGADFRFNSFKGGLKYLYTVVLPKSIAAAEAAAGRKEIGALERLMELESYKENFEGTMGTETRKGRRGLIPLKWRQEWRAEAESRQTKSAQGAQAKPVVTKAPTPMVSSSTPGGATLEVSAETLAELELDEAAQDAQG